METKGNAAIATSLGLYARLMEKQSHVRRLEQQLADAREASEKWKRELQKQRLFVQGQKTELEKKRQTHEDHLQGISQRINQALTRIPQEKASIRRLSEQFATLSEEKKRIVATHAAQSSAVMQMDRYKEYVSTLSHCFPDLPPPSEIIKRLSRLYTVDNDLSRVRLQVVGNIQQLRKAKLIQGQVSKMTMLRDRNLQQKSPKLSQEVEKDQNTEDDAANEENAKLGRLIMALDALTYTVSTNPACVQLLSCKTLPAGVIGCANEANISGGAKSPSVEKWKRAVLSLKSKANSPCPSAHREGVPESKRRSPSGSSRSPKTRGQTSLEKLQLIQEVMGDLRLVVEELQRATKAPGSCQPDYTRTSE